MYLPSRYKEEGRLAHLIYFQDVSGSIDNKQILRFNSELKYVWDYYKPRRMTIVQFDTKIQKVDEFKEGDPFTEIKIIGRGGTCLKCVRQFIIDHKPTAAIIFSDMHVAPMEKLPIQIPILWVAVDAPWAKVPFGKIIHIKETNMPALDSLVGGGATHISDRNRYEPIKTLCGQALDKESTKYYTEVENFQQASCKVCRGIFFGESWTSNSVIPEPKEEVPPGDVTSTPRALFANLSAPVNEHPPVEKQDGS